MMGFMDVFADKPKFMGQSDPGEAAIQVIRGRDAILGMHSMLVELGGRLRSTDELLDEESSSASSRRMVAVGAT